MSHTVHRSTETGNFVVADKDGKILHTFPTEGEANLQAQYLDEKEKAEKKEAKTEDKAEAKANDEKPHGRHR